MTTGDGSSIYHITTAAAGQRLLDQGTLAPESLAIEGFVHCSTAAQVVDSTVRHFTDDANLVLVELDPERIDAEVTWPEVYTGVRFPHVHGPLTAAAVVAVHPWAAADQRRWAPAPPR